MQVHGTRFGSLTFRDEDVFYLDDGLMGFPMSKRFLLFPYSEESSFFWLQSVDEPEIAFIVINPFEFFSDLNFAVSDEDSQSIGLLQGEDVEVFSLVNVPEGEPEAVRTNLAGPVIVNVRNRKGKQILVGEYSPQQPLIPEELRKGTKERVMRSFSEQQMVAV